MRKKVQKICYRCIKPKEDDRLDQPFCRKCATDVMREIRKNNVTVNVSLAESILKLIPKDSPEHSKLSQILEKKHSRLNKKL